MVFDVQADVLKNRLFIRIEGRVDDADALRFSEAVVREMERLRPGFDLVSDFTLAEPLGPEGMSQFKRIMAAARERQIGRTVRIVGRAAQLALQFARTSKELGHEPYIAFSREEAERLLDGPRR